MSTLKESSVYTYKLADPSEKYPQGLTLSIRRLSEKEREALFERIAWDIDALQSSIDRADQEQFLAVTQRIYTMLAQLCPNESHKPLSEMRKYAYRYVWLGILSRIVNVEAALRDGKPVPADKELEEFELETANGETLEAEGEELPVG